jgi:hypothetical protein
MKLLEHLLWLSKRSGGTLVGGVENERTGAKHPLVEQRPHTRLALAEQVDLAGPIAAGS